MKLRRAVAHVVVRLAGVYFAYLAIKKMGMIPYAFYVFSQVDQNGSVANDINIAMVIPGLIGLLIHGGLSYYLLIKGEWLRRFLNGTDLTKPGKVEQGEVGNSE